MSARIGVVTFPGTLDDRDALRAVRHAGGEPVSLWHADPQLHGVAAVILPGGFSYGDYLRCGAIARFAPVMASVVTAAAAGLPVLGICNGFQILCEAGLLRGALRPNASLSFVCRDVTVRVERHDTPFTSLCDREQTLTLPVKHGDGCFYAPADLADEQVVFRYGEGHNPNGSASDVAGVINADGNVLGLMPHPEHAVDPLLGSTDGALVLASLLAAVRERALAAAA